MQCWSIGCCWDTQHILMQNKHEVDHGGGPPALCSGLACPYVFIRFLNQGIFSGVGRDLCPHQEGMRTRGGRVSNLKNAGPSARQRWSTPLNHPTGVSFVFKLTFSAMWSLCTHLQSLEGEVHQKVTPHSIPFDAFVLLLYMVSAEWFQAVIASLIYKNKTKKRQKLFESQRPFSLKWGWIGS